MPRFRDHPRRRLGLTYRRAGRAVARHTPARGFHDRDIASRAFPPRPARARGLVGVRRDARRVPLVSPAFARGAASSRGLAAFALAPTAATATTATTAAAFFAARGVSTSAPAALAAERPPRGEPASTDLQQSEERFDEITDKWIPEKPVSAAEAGGYSLVIAAGLAVALGAMWYSFKELLFEPKEQSVFAAALSRVETDPRVVVRVGEPMTAYGKEGRSRSARRQLAHTTHVDGFGREHVRVQGAVRGPRGKGTVHADAYKSDGGAWGSPTSSSTSGEIGWWWCSRRRGPPSCDRRRRERARVGGSRAGIELPDVQS